MKISDHFLEIERGRYKKLKRNERLCQMCSMNVVEDEIHYFFHCPKYNEIRKELFKDICIRNEFETYVKLMSSSSHLQYVALFIKKSR